MVTLKVNGKTHALDIEGEMPLLWALRDEIGLTGTKFGCGIAQCGACTVHVDGVAMRSCSVPVASVAGKNITTIEGLASADGKLHPCKPPGSPKTSRNAAIANRARSWRRRRC